MEESPSAIRRKLDESVRKRQLGGEWRKCWIKRNLILTGTLYIVGEWIGIKIGSPRKLGYTQAVMGELIEILKKG